MTQERKQFSALLAQSKFRNFLKWGWVFSLWGLGFLRFAKRAISRRGGVVVLTFHRVLPDAAMAEMSSLPGMVVSQSTFSEFLRYLSQHYEVINLQDANRSTLFDNKRLRIAVTFDDGWRDSAEVAYPVSRANNIPMVIFVCPGKMGTKSPFWPEKVVGLLRNLESPEALEHLRQILPSIPGFQVERFEEKESKFTQAETLVEFLKTLAPEKRDEFIQKMESLTKTATLAEGKDFFDETMSWSQAAMLSSSGVTIGSHTQNHSILTALSLNEVARELSDSKKEIEQQLGRACQMFAYPNGNCNTDVRNAAEHAGYDLAFTTQPGFWTRENDPCLIPRINIWEGSLAGPTSTFSKIAFQYCVFWKAFQANRKQEL